MKFKIYTDGACSGNPGKGGWAAIILDGKNQSSISGSENKTTNNRMELMATIKALKEVNSEDLIEIYTDSKYVKNGITDWIHKALLVEDKSLARYSRKFIDANLTSRDAVLAEPPLEASDLENLGINKLGDQRRILRMLQRLRDGGDDGILKKGDTLASAFGDGIVQAHRQGDDIYEIDLGWGKMYAFEEKAGIRRKKHVSKTREQRGATEGNHKVLLSDTSITLPTGMEYMQKQSPHMQAQEYKEH